MAEAGGGPPSPIHFSASVSNLLGSPLDTSIAFHLNFAPGAIHLESALSMNGLDFISFLPPTFDLAANATASYGCFWPNITSSTPCHTPLYADLSLRPNGLDFLPDSLDANSTLTFTDGENMPFPITFSSAVTSTNGTSLLFDFFEDVHTPSGGIEHNTSSPMIITIRESLHPTNIAFLDHGSTEMTMEIGGSDARFGMNGHLNIGASGIAFTSLGTHLDLQSGATDFGLSIAPTGATPLLGDVFNAPFHSHVAVHFSTNSTPPAGYSFRPITVAGNVTYAGEGIASSTTVTSLGRTGPNGMEALRISQTIAPMGFGSTFNEDISSVVSLTYPTFPRAGAMVDGTINYGPSSGVVFSGSGYETTTEWGSRYHLNAYNYSAALSLIPTGVTWLEPLSTEANVIVDTVDDSGHSYAVPTATVSAEGSYGSSSLKVVVKEELHTAPYTVQMSMLPTGIPA